MLWLNLGDSYCSASKWGGESSGKNEHSKLGGFNRGRRQGDKKNTEAGIPTLGPNRSPQADLKDKDLVGVPWMVAFALRSDGWWLRSEVVWAKGLSFCPTYSGSVMPESVRDRPSRTHETLFLLTKAATYFYDEVAVRERAVSAEEIRWDDGSDGHGGGISHAGQGTSTRKFRPGRLGNVARNLDVPTRPNDHLGQSVPWEGVTRNLRSVWAISPQPYAEAHFATMAPAVARPCVLAGTSERGCCRFCGAPWERICNRDRIEDRPNRVHGRDGDSLADAHGRDGRSGNRFSLLGGGTVGWSPTCRCRNQRGRTVPPVVLDPFAGSGTTLFVARELGRHAVGIDLNPEYVKLAADRVRQEVLW